MADESKKLAYIGIERDEESLKYIAKIFNRPPRPITKKQYNDIVKALRGQDWKNNDEDEASVINRIIENALKSAESEDV